jgi:hypothetical protein
MGGIGKTTLADAVVRALAHAGTAHEIGWVTARQQRLQWQGPLQTLPDAALTTAALTEELCRQLLDERIVPVPLGAPRDLGALLRATLKARPHLIVIDNLETVTDLETLVAAVREMAAPTKFLLTTRESLATQPGIFHLAVPELSPTHALALIRQEAQERNLTDLAAASDGELLPVVAMVGGNPLALRLVVGQCYAFPLRVVLENLARARSSHVENLYRYLYQQAWARLDETSRRVLLAMPLVTPAGAELAHLVEISEMDEAQVVDALNGLTTLNLVDVRGDLHARRYSIHNLTRTFLHTDILRWQ